MSTIVKKLTVKNELGMHARPAALFVELANKYESDIYVSKGDRKINGKSIMGLMMLAAAYGTKLSVEIDGDDAEKAMKAIEELFLNNFYE